MTRQGQIAVRSGLRALSGQHVLTRFVLVGVWNTAFGYGEWALLQFLLGDRLHYLVILVLAWPIAVANAYICSRRLVFRSTGSVLRELPRFSLVYVVTLIASLAALPLLLRTLPFNIYVIQAGYTLAVVALSFLAHRFFSFRGPSQRGQASTETGGDHV